MDREIMTYFLEVLGPCYSGAIRVFWKEKLTYSAAKINNVFVVGMTLCQDLAHFERGCG